MSDMAASLLGLPGWQRRFPALSYSNFRLWLAARVAWTFAMTAQGVTTGYLIYELTHSTAYLGYYAFAHGLPILTLSLYGGIIADRLPRRLLVMVTQALWALPAALLAILVFGRVIQPWHFILMGFASGLIYAFDNPARNCFVPMLVKPQDLANGAMLDNMVYYGVAALAAAAAGIIYVQHGAGWCYVTSALAFALPVAAIARMKVSEAGRAPARRPVGHELREGVTYVLSHPAERTLLVTLGMTTFFGLAITSSLFPAWAVRVLHGDAATNGIMSSAFGLGGVSAALFIATLGRFNFKGKLLAAGALVGPAMLLLFSQMQWLPLSLLCLAGVGMTLIPVVGLSATLLQILTPDALRGRVMSMFTLVNYGMQTLGGLFLGVIAQGIGVQITVVATSSILLLGVLAAFALEPKVRALE